MKQIPGRRYIPTTKTWLIPVTKANIENVLSLRWCVVLASSLPPIAGLLETPLKRAYTAPQGAFKPGSQPIYPTAEIKPIVLPEGLKLYPFQKRGIELIESRKGRILIGDEMGLGKTVQALGWLRIHPELRPAIVVCPASLKLNWQAEAKTWLDLKQDRIEVLGGRPSETNRIYPGNNILIINYDVLFDIVDKKTKKITQLGWWSVLKNQNPKVLIIDEIHSIKSSIAQRTKAVQALANTKSLENKIPHIIGLSGTPIVNRPIEFYNTISLIDPTLFPNWFKFTERYCGRFQKTIYRKNKNGKVIKRNVNDYTGATNIDELSSILTSSIMIRRLKKDVLQDLPDKIRSVVPLEITNRAEYTEAKNNFITWLRTKEGWATANRAEKAEALVQLSKLKQLTLRGKLDPAIDWINSVIDSGEKLVLFVTRHETADILMEKFGKLAVKLTGKESLEERQNTITVFQKDPTILLFVGMIDQQGRPAGVGITLTTSTLVAFVDHPASPLIADQCEDRTHRIGQKNAVNVYYLIAENTIEEDMIGMLDRKREILTKILDGKDPEPDSILVDLLNKLRSEETE